jgi:hypothetical protein
MIHLKVIGAAVSQSMQNWKLIYNIEAIWYAARTSYFRHEGGRLCLIFV